MSRRRNVRNPGRSGSAPAVAECDPKQRSAIADHVAKFVGPAAFVLHEERSELVHVDVHFVPPSNARPYWFLFTTGMSAIPMQVPAGMGLVPHAELCLRLPAWWQVGVECWKREPKWWWPIGELRGLATFPHRHRTWLGGGHTIASGDPPQPYDSSTELAGMLLLPCVLDEEDPKAVDTYVATELLELWPIHAEELAFKQAHCACALVDLLEAAGVTAVLDPDRPNVAAGVWMPPCGSHRCVN